MTNEIDMDLIAPLDPSPATAAPDGPGILDTLDPDLTQRLTSRRGVFARAAAGLGVLATAPMLLATASQEAFGLGLGVLLPAQVNDVLNFALTLERLEDEFYRTANSAPGLIPPEYQAVFQQIGKHESEHVAALSLVLGIVAAPSPRFDFTAGGRFPDVFSNFRTFAALSQTFEDLGVRAYKGQATNLMGVPLILTTALRIHSVEARHAAEVRRVRRVRPWDGGAFDEPLSKAQVLARAAPFIVGPVA